VGTDRPTPYDELMRMSDAQLVAHARERHPAGAAGLETAKRCVALVFERHRDSVRALCAGRAPAGDVDDLAAEVYARFVRTVYTHTTPVERPGGLLITIACRVVASFYERRKPGGAPIDEAGTIGTHDDGYERIEAESVAAELLGVLDDRQRDVVWLRVMAKLPSREVADRMKMTVANVDVVFYRAMKRMREELSG
jgi:RNA polymerase sigma factor (sigma-70 family)